MKIVRFVAYLLAGFMLGTDAAQLCGAAFGLTFDMDYCNVAAYDRMRETHGLANVSGIELTDDG